MVKTAGKKITLSVIMAVNNGIDYLNDSVESVFNQSFTNFEFIIVLDGQSRVTKNFLQRWSRKDKRIRLVSIQQKLGLTVSLNRALNLSSGKYVARQDADDISLPLRFEKQLNFLEAHPEIFLVGSWATNIDRLGNRTTVFRPPTDSQKVAKMLEGEYCLRHSSVMFRNDQNARYREKFVYAQDYDFYLNLLTQKRQITNLPEILIKYRVNPDAISFAKRPHQALFAEKARQFYLQRLDTGRDDYDNFDPQDILDVNIALSKDKIVLQSFIESSFKINNFPESRNAILRYFKIYGLLNKYFIYYLASFLPGQLINVCRKLIWR